MAILTSFPSCGLLSLLLVNQISEISVLDLLERNRQAKIYLAEEEFKNYTDVDELRKAAVNRTVEAWICTENECNRANNESNRADNELARRKEVEASLTNHLTKTNQEIGVLRSEKESQKEKYRELLFRRVLRQEIERIELEFKKLKTLVAVLQNDPQALAEWNKKSQLPVPGIPTIFSMPKHLKIKFTDEVLDTVQIHREERWFFYLENPPNVPVSFMPKFFEFMDKIKQKNIDHRTAASETAYVYRVISNPYHEESSYILDKYPRDRRISILARTNKIVKVFTDDLDIKGELGV